MKKYLQIAVVDVDAQVLECACCPRTSYVFSLDKTECVIECCNEDEALVLEEAGKGKVLSLEEAQSLVASAAYTVPLEPSPKPVVEKEPVFDALAEFKKRAS